MPFSLQKADKSNHSKSYVNPCQCRVWSIPSFYHAHMVMEYAIRVGSFTSKRSDEVCPSLPWAFRRSARYSRGQVGGEKGSGWKSQPSDRNNSPV